MHYRFILFFSFVFIWLMFVYFHSLRWSQYFGTINTIKFCANNWARLHVYVRARVWSYLWSTWHSIAGILVMLYLLYILGFPKTKCNYSVCERCNPYIVIWQIAVCMTGAIYARHIFIIIDFQLFNCAQWCSLSNSAIAQKNQYTYHLHNHVCTRLKYLFALKQLNGRHAL